MFIKIKIIQLKLGHFVCPVVRSRNSPYHMIVPCGIMSHHVTAKTYDKKPQNHVTKAKICCNIKLGILIGETL